MNRSIETVRLTIRVSSGTEGHWSDPYGYTEYIVQDKQNGRTTILHLGLDEHVRRDLSETKNARIRNHKRLGNVVEFPSDSLMPKYTAEELFHFFTGLTPEFIERCLFRKEKHKYQNCPNGGKHVCRESSGYPGESFDICVKCENIVNSYFHESEII